jgi:putative solute:sodium symporter small subunit
MGCLRLGCFARRGVREEGSRMEKQDPARAWLDSKGGGKSMQLTEKHHEYWSKNLRITAFLLSIWFIVTFVFGWFARELNEIVILGPLGFYMGAQGSLIIYVLIIWYYGNYMNNLDKEYGVHEGEDE